MRHYMFVGDAGEVLGVWVVPTAVAATRLRLELALKYPDCETVADGAADFESFKAVHDQYEFGDIEPLSSLKHAG